jgi:ferric-dicitrate binding protein FerR (iron transport regulator)
MNTLRQCWQVSEDTAAFLENRRQGSRRGVSRRVAIWAVAACLAVAVLGGLVFSNREAGLTGPNRSAALTGENLPLVIKLADGGHIIPGVAIQTLAGESRSLILNGRHRVVMKAGTRLSIRSLLEADRVGYLVSLALGEVYVHVEHDGHPFVVQTAHGRAVITGTTFDVKTTEGGTTLVVAEGSVRFESEGGAVQVMAEQQATISGSLVPPSTPTACDATALTAWARPFDRGRQMAQDVRSDDLLLEGLPALPSPRAGGQIELERIDHAQWVEQKRDWFTRQFPWIFQLRDALLQEKVSSSLATNHQPRATIAVPDYPELLFQTGDIWQINYPHCSRRVIPAIRPRSLREVAAGHGLDIGRLDQIITSAKSVRVQPPQMLSGIEALKQWLSDADSIQGPCGVYAGAPDDLHESFLAMSVYLKNTRTLAWLCVWNNRLEIDQTERVEILECLRQQVQLAFLCERIAWDVRETDSNNYCVPRRAQSVPEMINAIETIYENETRIKGLRINGYPNIHNPP